MDQDEVRTAFLCPGQGAYYEGLFTSLTKVRSHVREVLAEVDPVCVDHLGEPLSDTLLGTPRSLDWWLHERTDLLQVALVTGSIITARMLADEGLEPDVLVGHSLGEIAALTLGGAYTPAQAARIVIERQRAIHSVQVAEGYMAALSGPLPRIQALVDAVGDSEAVVAVVNHRLQCVVSGPTASLDRITALADVLRVGARKLKSPFPFHSPLLAAAVAPFAEALASIPSAPLTARVYSPIMGREYEANEDLATALASHFTRPVRFDLAVDHLRSLGVTTMVEAGALTALSSSASRLLSAEDSITVVAPLPGRGDEVKAWGAALAPVTAGATDVPPAVVREALTPSISEADFAAFWRSHGAGIRSAAASAVAAFANARSAADQAPVVSDAPVASVSVASVSAAAPVAAEAPAPAAAAPAGVALSAEAVLGELIEMYAQALEYPAEVFTATTHLEGELGVDSVKQTELLARVAQRYNLPDGDDDGAGIRVADYPTLGDITTLVTTHGSAAADSDSTATPPAADAVQADAPAGSVAPAPAPAAAASAGVALSAEAVLGELIEMYAQALEYPAEVFTATTHLEGELGVDSVKQTELLARVAQRYNLPDGDDDGAGIRVADYPTLGDITTLVTTHGSAAADSADTTTGGAPAEATGERAENLVRA
ncbi:MAG: acyltransferase domain-containing protein [Dermatophilus congolensis]|nr:acyltransferase domain-containing protein [Dermatophilus congolensis]